MSAAESAVAGGTETVAAPAKLAPEALLFRGSPVRAIRFKRELIIGVAAVAVIAIVIAA